jgi:hypothetical protein
MPVVAFWFAIAAISIFGMHLARRTQELKHETLRMLVEKGEKIDESLLRELLGPPGQARRQDRQQTYRGLRIAAAILFCIAPGLVILFLALGAAYAKPGLQILGLGIGALVALVGLGLRLGSNIVNDLPQQEP